MRAGGLAMFDHQEFFALVRHIVVLVADRSSVVITGKEELRLAGAKRRIVGKVDAEHIEAMQQMQELMKSPEGMNAWFENKRKEFDALPDDSSN